MAERAWAIFVARTILGFMVAFSGASKASPIDVLELVLGTLILIGLWTRPALVLLGGVVAIVAGVTGVTGLLDGRFGPTGMSIAVVNESILPQAALVVFLLLMPDGADRYSVDGRLTSFPGLPRLPRLWPRVSTAMARGSAALVARTLLGIVFFVAGVNKVFVIGPLVHAKTLFVDPYAATFLPVWGLWASGTVIPFLELVAGGLVLLGFWTRPSLFVLGSILIFVMFGHLVLQPAFVANSFILPRTALLVIVLLLPSEADAYSLDRVLKSRFGASFR